MISRKDATLLGLSLAGFAVAGFIISGKLRAGPESETEAPRSHGEYRADLIAEYDLADPLIEIDDLLAPGFIGRDGIPAITDPEMRPAADTGYPSDDARVVAVRIGDDAAAFPLGILNWHEIVNTEVGGTPIAVTYCPLCDSASVFDRRLETEGGVETLEFGVSGLLYNSNVVMYERGTMGLWSQVLMRAVTGPHSGRSLEHLPVRVTSFAEFKREHPEGRVQSVDTGHRRPYERNPYASYFENETEVFHAFEHDDRLPPKELGLGIRAGATSVFVTSAAARDAPVTVPTELGPVVVRSAPEGMRVELLPEGASAVQTFYHSWAAFHPQTEIIRREAPERDAPAAAPESPTDAR